MLKADLDHLARHPTMMRLLRCRRWYSLYVPSSAVGAPRVSQSFRAGIRWEVGSHLLGTSPSDDPSIFSDASMQRKLRVITSLLFRQNLLQAAPTHLIITLIPPTALLPVISSGLIGVVPHVQVSIVRHSRRPPARVLPRTVLSA